MLIHLETPSFEMFTAQFKGEVILPGSTQYKTARHIWNGIIDKYPALIVRPRDTADVVTAVNYARETGLLISVRGGGHNVAGHATNDDGIVIDLSEMKKILVDPLALTACAEGGVTWGELDDVTQVYGLATPGGVFSKTGIAGLTLGGGYGWLRNKYGLSCDNLIGAEVVTANGEVIWASEKDNPELLWGLRGGGGNFGIVTTFEYRLHAIGKDVMMAFVFHDVNSVKDMKRAVHLYRDYSANAPDEVSTIMAIGQFPPDEHFPEELHLKRFALFAGVYVGDVEKGQRALQPLLDFGTPLLDFSGVKPYLEAQKMFDNDYPDGLRYYWKSLNLNDLTEETIDRIVEHARQQVSPYSTTDLWHIGGAVKRVPASHGAFNGRRSNFLLNVEANWSAPQGDASNIAWARHFIDNMRAYSDGSQYLNFPGFQEEGNEMMQKSFGEQYDRLTALKRQYDPHNLFRVNQNIKP